MARLEIDQAPSKIQLKRLGVAPREILCVENQQCNRLCRIKYWGEPMNEKNNYLLSGPELVAVSTKLAEVSYDGMTTVPRLLAKMEISPYRFNLNKPLLDVWF